MDLDLDWDNISLVWTIRPDSQCVSSVQCFVITNNYGHNVILSAVCFISWPLLYRSEFAQSLYVTCAARLGVGLARAIILATRMGSI